MRNNRPTWLRLERVENGVSVGMPDVYAVGQGVSCWVELKASEALPKRPSTPLLGGDGLTVEQRNWHMDHARFGGRSFVLVGAGRGATAEQMLLPGWAADDINAMPVSELRANALARAWPAIFAHLCKRNE